MLFMLVLLILCFFMLFCQKIEILCHFMNLCRLWALGTFFVDIPAAKDSRRWSGVMCGEISRSTFGRTCGFTESATSLFSLTSLTLSVVVLQPSFMTCVFEGALAHIWLICKAPAAINPLVSVSASVPAPKKANCGIRKVLYILCSFSFVFQTFLPEILETKS